MYGVVVIIMYNNKLYNDVLFFSQNMKTPLHYAVQGGYENVASILLNNGANVNAVDKVKINTELHIKILQNKCNGC